VPVIRDTNNVPAIAMQDFLQPVKAEARPVKRKKPHGKRLLAVLLLLGMLAGVGYYFRNTAPIRKVLHRGPSVVPLPDLPFVRPVLTTAEYSITLSAVQNGLPSNVTTRVQEDYANQLGQSTIESQVGGTFTSTQEIRNRESLYHPGLAYGKEWSRQTRVLESPSPYDTAEFIPMINDIIDQPLRDAMEPTSSKSSKVDGSTITTLTYVLDRARVPEIAPAIFARVPWLFDVPNAPTLTVEVSYDQAGLVRHLYLGVDPPQPGTGSDATWVTSYTLDVTTVNVPVVITVPVDVVDVPPGTP
jgi:hypothetical protein